MPEAGAMRGSADSGDPTVSGLWWLVVTQGVAAVLLGLFLFVRPGLTAVLMVQVIGVWWLLGGVLGLVGLLGERTKWGFRLARGALGVLAGAVVIAQPVLSTVLMAAVYVLILGAIGLLIGAVEIIFAFRGGGWPVGAVGVLSILLALLILAAPVWSLLSVPAVFGALSVAFGAAGVAGGLRLRRGPIA